jgi:hypothetical protein
VADEAAGARRQPIRGRRLGRSHHVLPTRILRSAESDLAVGRAFEGPDARPRRSRKSLSQTSTAVGTLWNYYAGVQCINGRVLAKRTHLSGAFKQPVACRSPDEGETFPRFLGGKPCRSNMVNFTPLTLTQCNV